MTTYSDLTVRFKTDKKWDEWADAIKAMSKDFKDETKSFMRKESTSARKEISDYYKENHNVTGRTAKSWKKTKPKMNGRGVSAEVYSESSLLHLLEDGHDIVLGGPKAPRKNKKGRSGHVVGRVKAYKPFSTVSEIVSEDYLSHSDKFLSELLGRYNL